MSGKLAIHGGKPIRGMPPIKSPIGQEELAAAARVISNGVLSNFRGGAEVRNFEKAFAQYIGSKYAVATTSGTTALHACIAALPLNHEDEVLVPALTFASTASVVIQEGAKVVFVDIDDTFCMDIQDLKAKISPKSKAIIPVHLYGQAANMEAINALAAEHGLVVIEDACQSHGAKFNNSRTGNLGKAGCFSFFQTKNMTTGEGGMITTSDEDFYKELCLRREHGSPRDSVTWYNYVELGYNYNMTELQGAIGLVQLKKLDKMNQQRINNANLYLKYLADTNLDLPKTAKNNTHVWHNFPVLLPVKYRKSRNFVLSALKAEGIPCDVAYPKPLYETDFFIKRNIGGNCPSAEEKSSRLITLFTDLSVDESLIIDTKVAFNKILNFLEKNNEAMHISSTL